MKMSIAKRKEAARLYSEEKLSIANIALRFGVSYACIRALLLAQHIDLRTKNKESNSPENRLRRSRVLMVKTYERNKHIVHLSKNGESMVSIARTFNLSPQRIKEILIQMENRALLEATA